MKRLVMFIGEKGAGDHVLCRGIGMGRGGVRAWCWGWEMCHGLLGNADGGLRSWSEGSNCIMTGE